MHKQSMTGMPLTYALPDGRGYLVLEEHVVSHLVAHRQQGWRSTEAGGQLFGVFEGNEIWRVQEATGPRATDWRTLFGFVPDRAAEQNEIAERYLHGLHFMGDWHTHRQKLPSPSSTDLNSMRDMVRRSAHGLDGFMLIVVGQAEFPEGLHVSFHTKLSSTVLEPRSLPIEFDSMPPDVSHNSGT